MGKVKKARRKSASASMSHPYARQSTNDAMAMDDGASPLALPPVTFQLQASTTERRQCLVRPTGLAGRCCSATNSVPRRSRLCSLFGLVPLLSATLLAYVHESCSLLSATVSCSLHTGFCSLLTAHFGPISIRCPLSGVHCLLPSSVLSHWHACSLLAVSRSIQPAFCSLSRCGRMEVRPKRP